ncbi:MAG: hypothetical protein LBP92_10715 [Deltaproteobacteria bacterium]|jgi:hypothetical protein|nr:hypothetical protein [Deltaproteobacteria bacterium]
MELSTLIFLTVGIPLILVALAFLLICLRWLWSKDQRANQAKLLEAASRLDASLAGLEARLSALEDILLPPAANRAPPADKGDDFDRRLAQSQPR